MRRWVCVRPSRVRWRPAVGSEAILRSGPRILRRAGPRRRSDDDGDGTTGDPGRAGVDGGDAGCGDGVYGKSARTGLFSVCVVVLFCFVHGNKKQKSIESVYFTYYTPTDDGSLAESCGGGGGGGGGGISVALKVETNNGILTVCLSGAVA